MGLWHVSMTLSYSPPPKKKGKPEEKRRQGRCGNFWRCIQRQKRGIRKSLQYRTNQYKYPSITVQLSCYTNSVDTIFSVVSTCLLFTSSDIYQLYQIFGNISFKKKRIRHSFKNFLLITKPFLTKQRLNFFEKNPGILR